MKDVVILIALGLLVSACGYVCKVSYDEDGAPHADRSLFSCAQEMQDPKFPITNVKKYENETLVVTTQFVLNNLISVDEIENTVELDFYWRMFWKDRRWVRKHVNALIHILYNWAIILAVL